MAFCTVAAATSLAKRTSRKGLFKAQSMPLPIIRCMSSGLGDTPERSQLPLAGKTALVTGSTAGIGLGIAKSLASAGCSVIINGFGDVGAAISEVATVISSSSGATVGHVDADLGSPVDAADVITKAREAAGRPIDILVNNVGIQHISDLQNMPNDKWKQIIDLNLSSAFYTTKAATTGMLENGWGRIINIASVHGHVASANKSAYVAAKHGLIGLSKSTGIELAGTGVTCVAVCPGWVRTALVENQISLKAEKEGISFDEAKEALLTEKMPSGTFVEVEALGETVVFLCSKHADQITGTSIMMDGGWTAQ